MEEPMNRMNKPGRRPEGAYVVIDAPPVVVDGKILPCTCPRCGKGMQPRLLKRMPAHIRVVCTSCAGILHYIPAGDGYATPRVRYEKA